MARVSVARALRLGGHVLEHERLLDGRHLEALTHVRELSARQLGVFGALAKGMSNRQIAAALGISEYTVKVYIGRIIDVLRLESRLQIGTTAPCSDGGARAARRRSGVAEVSRACPLRGRVEM